MIAPVQTTSRAEALRPELERLFESFGPAWREKDPVRYAHRPTCAADREVTAFLAATLAFGQVKAIFRTLDGFFASLGPAPADTIRESSPRALAALVRGFRHRWVGDDDLARFLRALRAILREDGSIEAAFMEGDDPSAPTIQAGLEALAARFRATEGAGSARVAKFLLPAPSSGSACKRANLFLRWVVRPADGLDLGLWTTVDRRRLIIPLDVHVAFHGRVLGLTRRRQNDWKAACEVTAALRELDPDDPVRYDFSLCHLGIHGDCQKRHDPSGCPSCPLDRVCRLPARRIR